MDLYTVVQANPPLEATRNNAPKQRFEELDYNNTQNKERLATFVTALQKVYTLDTFTYKSTMNGWDRTPPGFLIMIGDYIRYLYSSHDSVCLINNDERLSTLLGHLIKDASGSTGVRFVLTGTLYYVLYEPTTSFVTSEQTFDWTRLDRMSTNVTQLKKMSTKFDTQPIDKQDNPFSTFVAGAEAIVKFATSLHTALQLDFKTLAAAKLTPVEKFYNLDVAHAYAAAKADHEYIHHIYNAKTDKEIFELQPQHLTVFRVWNEECHTRIQKIQKDAREKKIKLFNDLTEQMKTVLTSTFPNRTGIWNSADKDKVETELVKIKGTLEKIKEVAKKETNVYFQRIVAVCTHFISLIESRSKNRAPNMVFENEPMRVFQQTLIHVLDYLDI